MTGLPPAESLFAAIRESCAACTARSSISIDGQAIDTFISGIKQEDWTPSNHGLRMPLAFESVEDELNVLATLALLNFLSGYRYVLHRMARSRRYSTILSTVLAAYLSSPDSLLSTTGMIGASAAQLASLARISTHTERQHESLPVTVGVKDDEALEVLELLAGVLQQTGAALRAAGHESLGAWVHESLVAAEGNAGAFVHDLASTFPAFRDVHVVDGEPVYLFKKALWLATVVSLRFKGENVSFQVPAVVGTPVFADNVLPTLLVHRGILSLSSSTDPALAALSLAKPDTLLLSSDSATRLRAAAVT
ncbi:uncharacterized protein RHOBADRAFT_66540, partial [Rhodotorula graminis WP1]